MQIVFIGRDRQGVDRNSPLVERWRGLVRQGAQVTIILLSETRLEWQEEGIRVLGVGGKTFLQRWWNAYRIGRHLAGVDLISAQDPAELGLLALILGRKIGAKVEVQDHGGWFDGSTTIEEPLWRLRKWCGDYLVSRVDAIRTVNPQSYQHLAHQFGAKAYFLPIACADRFFSASSRPVRGNVLCVARLVPVKRHALLLEAFARLVQLDPQVKLTLVGSGPCEAALRVHAERLGISAQLQFAQSTDALPYLETAEVFILLSSHEGWGVAPVEAAVVGVPVVMTDTGCAPWLEEQGLAIRVTQPTPDRVAHAIQEARGRTMPKVALPRMQDLQREQVLQWKRMLHLS